MVPLPLWNPLQNELSPVCASSLRVRFPPEGPDNRQMAVPVQGGFQDSEPKGTQSPLEGPAMDLVLSTATHLSPKG